MIDTTIKRSLGQTVKGLQIGRPATDHDDSHVTSMVRAVEHAPPAS